MPVNIETSLNKCVLHVANSRMALTLPRATCNITRPPPSRCSGEIYESLLHLPLFPSLIAPSHPPPPQNPVPVYLRLIFPLFSYTVGHISFLPDFIFFFFAPFPFCRHCLLTASYTFRSLVRRLCIFCLMTYSYF